MLLDKRSIAEVEFKDVLALMESGVPEDTEIDYKEAVPPWRSYSNEKREAERDDFANDCCAFANAMGGWTVYGVKCRQTGDRSIPESICGIPDAVDLDQERQTLRDLARARTRPVVEIETKRLDGETTEGPRTVLVVRVPRSWNPPHMHAATHVCYLRQGPGKVRMDVDQLRRTILGSNEWRERLRAFLAVRQGAMKENVTPALPIPIGCVVLNEKGDTRTPMPAVARLAMYVTPTRSFDEEAFVDVMPLARGGNLKTVSSNEYSMENLHTRYVALLEGGLALGPMAEGPVTSSCSIFHRNGVVESLDSGFFRYVSGLDGITLTGQEARTTQIQDSGLRDRLEFVARSHSELIEELGHALPHGITICLADVEGWTLLGSQRSSGRFMRNDVALPVVTFEDQKDSLTEAIDFLFMGIWQAAGKDSAPPR